MEDFLTKEVSNALHQLYEIDVEEGLIQIQKTRKEYQGDFTLVLFPLLKMIKKAPEIAGVEIGQVLKKGVTEIVDFNTVKGYLNFSLSESYWIEEFQKIIDSKRFGVEEKSSQSETVLVEFSSPNIEYNSL